MAIDPEFVSRRTVTLPLRDGACVRLRPLVPEDKPVLVEGFRRLSAASRYRRFMTPIEELDDDMLRFLTELDYVNHFAWAALLPDETGSPGAGVSRYVRLEEEPEVAEAAVTVVDEHQGRGIGTLLLEALGAAALSNGVRTLRGYVMGDNREMREVAEAVGARLVHESPSLLRVEVDVPARAEQIKGTPLGEALTALARGEGPIHLC
ncbi:MAG: GNAT family N-acetyltransferase [Actinomycetota bacterium]